MSNIVRFLLYEKNIHYRRIENELKIHHMTNGTLQAKQAFAQKVYDVVEAYLEANDCTIYASDGVYVDAQLEPSIMSEADAEDPDRFYPLCSLIREDEETIEADKAMVEEIAEQYFV